MAMAAFNAAAGRHTHDGGTRKLASRSIPILRQFVDDLIEGRINEISKLDFRDRPQAVKAHTDCGTNDRNFRQGSIQNSLLAEFVEQTIGHSKNTAELCNVFAKNHDVGIPAHFDLQGVVQSLNHGHRAHALFSPFRLW
jgi:hypothetical protein